MATEPYFCEKCSHVHLKGKVFEDHKQFARVEKKETVVVNLPVDPSKEKDFRDWIDSHPRPFVHDLSEVKPGMNHVITPSGFFEVILNVAGKPDSLFDHSKRIERANFKAGRWEMVEPDRTSPNGMKLMTRPFTTRERLLNASLTCRARHKRFTITHRMAALRGLLNLGRSLK